MMKTLFRSAAFYLAAVLLVCGSPAARASETLDAIIVVVNDEIVTEQDLRTASEPILAQYRATLSGPEYDEKAAEIRKKVLDSLVDDRMIRGVAKREKIEVKESEVDEMMEDVQKKFPSKDIFERVMREQGLSFTNLRERFRDQILTRRVIDVKVKSGVSMSPGEVRAFYDEHKTEFQSPEKARVRQILLRVGEHRNADEANELASSILSEINKGTPVEDLAKKYSDAADAEQGGDMGWIEKGQLVEQIDAQIFALEAGQITSPIQSQLGYHIFKVEEKQPAQERTFDEVRSRAEGILYRKKTAVELEKWLAELRKNAYIAYKT